MFLSSFDLTPTYRNVNNKFRFAVCEPLFSCRPAFHLLLSVKYFLNLVLVDEDDRRYFKQQEIVLYRLAE